MKKVILKSGVVLGVSDERADVIMAAISSENESVQFLNGERGEHQCCIMLKEVDAVIDDYIIYEKIN